MLCAGSSTAICRSITSSSTSMGPYHRPAPSLNAAGNNNACRILERDVDNLAAYFAVCPQLLSTRSAGDVESLRERPLHAETQLTAGSRPARRRGPGERHPRDRPRA